MADIDLTQAQADELIAMEKHWIDDQTWSFPGPGEKRAVPITSADKRESFVLNITRSGIKLTKATYLERVHQTVVLIRVDLDGPPHRNPGPLVEEIPCPHIHLYREGFGDKWASPLPINLYTTRTTFGPFFMLFWHIATSSNYR